MDDIQWWQSLQIILYIPVLDPIFHLRVFTTVQDIAPLDGAKPPFRPLAFILIDEVPVLKGNLFAAVFGMFPLLMQRPIVSTVLAVVITSPVPMWTSITDGGWGYLVSGVLLYLLRNHRKAQVAVWALNSFLWDFVLVYLQLRGQPGFELSQMFTTYYEWFGVAAAVLMLAYNGTRGSGHKQLFYWFYPAHVYLLYGMSCLVYRLIA